MLLSTQSSSSSSYSFSSSWIQTSTFEYNSLLRAQTNIGSHKRALLLFRRMLTVDALPPDCFTFPTVLKACSHLSAAAEGEQIHSLFLKSHFVPSSDIFVLTSLIHFYACCGRLNDACQVFDQMPHKNMASWNAMLDGYARSGNLESAHKMFYEMPERNIISWNTMIKGCVRNGRAREALKIFLDLQLSGINPDESTMASILPAITSSGHLALGRASHAYITRHMFSLDRALGVALIDMYAKCGSLEAARAVFFAIDSKKVQHWTSMIAAFAAHGFADASLQLFDEMIRSGSVPNDITFITVLNACSHGGLVQEGLDCFKLLKFFGIEPSVRHYGCLIDLLARAGLADEAADIVRKMPVEPGSVIWSTLLAACGNHGRVEIGRAAAGKMIELDSGKGSSFVLLSNLYAKVGMWEDSSIVRKGMEERGLKKVAGFSWIEIDGQIHEFVAGDELHFKTGEIYAVLDQMRNCLRCREDFKPFF